MKSIKILVSVAAAAFLFHAPASSQVTDSGPRPFQPPGPIGEAPPHPSGQVSPQNECPNNQPYAQIQHNMAIWYNEMRKYSGSPNETNFQEAYRSYNYLACQLRWCDSHRSECL